MSKIQDFNLSVNLLEAILWQYNEAEKLNKIIQDKQFWHSTNVNEFMLNEWFTNVFNVDTANDFGLNVWAKILNVNFILPPESVRNNNVFGFGEYYSNFYDSNFSPPTQEDRSLSLEQKRLVIKLTYQKYHILPSVPQINKVIQAILGIDGYILDGFDMTNNYIILKEQFNQVDLRLLTEFDLLPRPAGVQIQFRTVLGNEFGFADYGMNFYNGFFAI